MRPGSFFAAFAPALALSLVASVHDARACGGCFVQQSESTQVTGHRMILSVSPDESTLWDQITYSGEPESFAWVLPIKDKVGIGLSSDALFETLEALTQVSVSSPLITCPQPPVCGDEDRFGGGATTSTATGTEPGVEVIAQEVVGPYETVQLKADDPNALTDWLASHGYEIPPDIVPVVAAYVGEGFGFLALKLVPGKGIDSMRPVRITTAGAGAALPLRMVAAGTGAITPITLWVMAEGRYEPTGFPTFQVHEEELVWDWDSQSSNYKALVKAGFDAAKGKAWLVEAGEQLSPYSVSGPLESLAQYSPEESGYADENGEGAAEALKADLGKLYGGIAEWQLAVTRLRGELTREALESDMPLEAADDQSTVQRTFEAKNTTGTAPSCPEFPPCDDGGSGGSGNGTGGDSGGIWDGIWGGGGGGGDRAAEPSDGDGGCAASGGHPETGALLGGLAVAAAALLVRRGRRRS